MLRDGTINLDNKGRLGIIAALALIASFSLFAIDAQAGTLAQLQLQSRAVKNAPRINACAGMAGAANCRAAFDTALHTAAQIVALKRGPQLEHTSSLASVARAPLNVAAPHALPLKFDTDPEWKKRAIVIAHEGITFLRMPQGENHEFRVGITRKGMLGFTLQDTTGR